MNYRSLSDLSKLITSNLHRIPTDVDLVVGIARSGILPAITISLMLNLRYADLDGFLEGRLAGAGSTKLHAGLIDNFSAVRHVLVIDDSLNRGDAMREAKERLRHLAHGIRFTFAAAYVVPDGRDEVDIALEILPLPRIFEWNFIHHVYLQQACVDIDGVLCLDPREEENDDGANYVRFLTGATPLYRPTRRIGWLVTSRLEKYRPQTEAWLARHGIQYDKLVMLDLPSAAERRRLGVHGKFKGETYRDSEAVLFIESEYGQAMEIARVSGKPVLSIEGQEMINPGAWSGIASIQKIRNLGVHAKMSGSPLFSKEAFKRRLKRILPPKIYAATWGVAASALKGARGGRPATVSPVVDAVAITTLPEAVNLPKASPICKDIARSTSRETSACVLTSQAAISGEAEETKEPKTPLTSGSYAITPSAQRLL